MSTPYRTPETPFSAASPRLRLPRSVVWKTAGLATCIAPVLIAGFGQRIFYGTWTIFIVIGGMLLISLGVAFIGAWLFLAVWCFEKGRGQ